MQYGYTHSLISPGRRLTREVRVGNVIIGGSRPIVVQSMTTTPTKDTAATVDQIARLVAVGCPMIRITTPSMADVENIPNIRAEMEKRGLDVPLVADVHFLPQVALAACDVVEKVRINPGNFADRKRFQVMEYSDAEYREELSRIREAFLPVVRRAKERGIALRIGTNHGSLSDRIMNRFGDTPLGMVESALEFVRIAEDESFFDLVLSMKASNTQVMIQAYRLLVKRMDELGMDYPLHLGVTEAGDGEDGRIKSALGIGSLLSDGIGDTIRVSLTEDPEFEIPVAQKIIEHYAIRGHVVPQRESPLLTWDPYSYSRRESARVGSTVGVGGKETVRVRTAVSYPEEASRLAAHAPLEPPVEMVAIDAFTRSARQEVLDGIPSDVTIVLRVGQGSVRDVLNDVLRFEELSLQSSGAWIQYADKLVGFLKNRSLWLRVGQFSDVVEALRVAEALSGRIPTGVEIEGRSLVALGRSMASALAQGHSSLPIHLRYVAGSAETAEDVHIRASVEIGSLLCDGIGDSVEITSTHGREFDHRLAFNILQGARVRMSKTEYIACPSCGRTLFDLQETTGRIRAKTSHLKGVKIAIMGCIVNGPGEMADADFGYVGAGPDRINLYVGKECVERGIPFQEADEKLMALIRAHGRWIEPN